MAIQRIQTDHDSEFATDLTRHLHDLGIAHRRIPRGRPEANGVERSQTSSTGDHLPDPAAARHKLRGWEHEYNHRRLHLALGGKTPAKHLLELRISTLVSVQESA